MKRAALLLVLAALAGCGGGNDDGESGEEAFSAVERRPQDPQRGRRSAPRYETVASLRGRGDAERTVHIDREAIQWRVRWRCDEGVFALLAGSRRLVRRRCPASGRAEEVETGPIRLRLRTGGAWRLRLDQQVDKALREPPLPEMRQPGTRTVASGRFYPIERRGKGNATLYRLSSGRLALRLDGFDTSANVDLFVWLSEARRPRTTKQVLASPHRQIALLKSTLGDQNFLLPRNVQTREARSVVIWCEPIQIAYTAAALSP